MLNSKAFSRKYVPDLQRLQGICSRNYGLLIRLLPLEYSKGSRWLVNLPGGIDFELSVRDKTPYTETMSLVQRAPNMAHFMATQIEFRVYHDAQMVEVLSYQNQTRLRQKYPYPNPMLFQKDEKVQVNALLKDWLNLVSEQYKAGQNTLLHTI